MLVEMQTDTVVPLCRAGFQQPWRNLMRHGGWGRISPELATHAQQVNCGSAALTFSCRVDPIGAQAGESVSAAFLPTHSGVIVQALAVALRVVEVVPLGPCLFGLRRHDRSVGEVPNQMEPMSSEPLG